MPEYGNLLIYGLAIGLTGLGFIGVSHILGPRRWTPEKLSPYECGVPLLSSAREPFMIKYYIVAILFVLFDVEIVFLIPWAVSYRSVGSAAFAVVEMLIFVGILAVGLLYAWKRGGLEWE